MINTMLLNKSKGELRDAISNFKGTLISYLEQSEDNYKLIESHLNKSNKVEDLYSWANTKPYPFIGSATNEDVVEAHNTVIKRLKEYNFNLDLEGIPSNSTYFNILNQFEENYPFNNSFENLYFADGSNLDNSVSISDVLSAKESFTKSFTKFKSLLFNYINKDDLSREVVKKMFNTNKLLRVKLDSWGVEIPYSKEEVEVSDAILNKAKDSLVAYRKAFEVVLDKSNQLDVERLNKPLSEFNKHYPFVDELENLEFRVGDFYICNSCEKYYEVSDGILYDSEKVHMFCSKYCKEKFESKYDKKSEPKFQDYIVSVNKHSYITDMAKYKVRHDRLKKFTSLLLTENNKYKFQVSNIDGIVVVRMEIADNSGDNLILTPSTLTLVTSNGKFSHCFVENTDFNTDIIHIKLSSRNIPNNILSVYDLRRKL